MIFMITFTPFLVTVSRKGKGEEQEISWALSAQVQILSTARNTFNKDSANDEEFFSSQLYKARMS